MLTPSELATFLRTSAARVRLELTDVTKEYLEEVAKEAKELIGQELEQWPPLAGSTVNEKQKLGYTGQVSSTDPLLRTGDLRNSIEAQAEATAEGAEGAVGSSSKVALWMERGTDGQDGSPHTPPRPFTSIALENSSHHAGEHYGLLGVALTLPPVR